MWSFSSSKLYLHLQLPALKQPKVVSYKNSSSSAKKLFLPQFSPLTLWHYHSFILSQKSVYYSWYFFSFIPHFSSTANLMTLIFKIYESIYFYLYSFPSLSHWDYFLLVFFPFSLPPARIYSLLCTRAF